jgi:hypothetical protein
MAVRREERLSAEALQRHLNDQYGIVSNWSGVEPDPPDLRFDITRPEGSTESWAVEVTAMVQRYQQEGKEDGGNRYDFEPRIMKILAKLNDELGPQMKCGYFLIVTGPLHPRVFRDLENRVREFVVSGKTEEEALDWNEVVASVRKNITADPDEPGVREIIEKVARDGTRVRIKATDGVSKIVALSGISGAAMVPNSDELAANVEATLDHATTYILQEKLPRMAKVSGYTRKVLLICKAIPTVNASHVAAALGPKVKTELDGIFLFEPGQGRVTLVLNNGLVPHRSQ